MVTEIELKYSLLERNESSTTEQIKATICQLLSNENIDFSYQEKKLKNHYFDTTELALRKQRIALRTRSTSDSNNLESFEQTIKTPGKVIAGLHQRPEYNVDIEDSKPVLKLFPALLWQDNTDLPSLQDKIIELFSTNFTRATWLITLANAKIELAFDSGQIACCAHDNKPKIYEIELELISGNKSELLLLTQLLFTQLSLRPGQLTKAARGYALYKESQIQTQKEDITNAKIPTSNGKTQKGSDKSISFVAIELSTKLSENEAFKQGVDLILTQLQLSVDRYVESPDVHNLIEITQRLNLLRHGFWLFKERLTDEALLLRDEISYFIKFFQWVHHADYIDVIKNKQGSDQTTGYSEHGLICQLEEMNYFASQTDVLDLLHSERFNHLQLHLLSLLLDDEGYILAPNTNTSFIVHAKKQLENHTDILTRELNVLTQSKDSLCPQQILMRESLLSRSLLTTNWFSHLFSTRGNWQDEPYNIHRLSVQASMNELQSLTFFTQQVNSLPCPELKFVECLSKKRDNLLNALIKSTIKALSIEPYWY